MARVDFLIANGGHHTAAALPVIRELRKRGDCICRAASIAELRGLESPIGRFAEEGVPLVPILPLKLRPSPAAGRSLALDGAVPVRKTLHRAVWRLLLRPGLEDFFDAGTDLAVLPNDGNFPYDRIAELLHRRSIPFLILQEGIRFDVPYWTPRGGSGAAAFALWGETSREYFAGRGVPPERLHVTGAPRLDPIVNRDWTEEAAAVRHRLGGEIEILLFLSNPIDDLGYTTATGKDDLIVEFARATAPRAEANPRFRLVIKLHPRESEEALARRLERLAHYDSIVLTTHEPLYPLLAASRAAVTFASTVGLEAMLLDVPLGILEIPGHGFVHDYVASGAAAGIEWGQAPSTSLAALLDTVAGGSSAARATYLERNTAHAGGAAARVADLVRDMLGTKP